MKHTLLVLLILACTTVLGAQNLRQGGERIESRKIAFITDILQLTPEEAQVYWPLYNEHKEAQKALKISLKNNTSSDAANKLRSHFAIEEKQLELRKEYVLKVEKVLGSERAIKLVKAERKFKEQLLKKYKKGR